MDIFALDITKEFYKLKGKNTAHIYTYVIYDNLENKYYKVISVHTKKSFKKRFYSIYNPGRFTVLGVL